MQGQPHLWEAPFFSGLKICFFLSIRSSVKNAGIQGHTHTHTEGNTACGKKELPPRKTKAPAAASQIRGDTALQLTLTTVPPMG